MGWAALIGAGMGVLKSNKETQEAANAAQRKSISQKGDWIFRGPASGEEIKIPNYWGNIMGGASSAMGMAGGMGGGKGGGSAVGDTPVSYEQPRTAGMYPQMDESQWGNPMAKGAGYYPQMNESSWGR